MQDTGSTLATYKRLFIPNPFSSDEENEAKKSAQQQEEDAESARRQRNYEKLQGFRDQLDTSIRKKLSDSVDEIKKIYENKVIPFENTDDSYKSKMSAYYSEWSSMGDKFSDVGNAIKNFLTGVEDSIEGTVKGLLTLVADLGILYADAKWKSIMPVEVPEVLDQEVEKIKQKYEPLLKDAGKAGKGLEEAAKGAESAAEDAGKVVEGGSKTNKLFKNQSLLDEHYGKHGQEIADVLGDSNYSIDKYLDDANYIINNGTYAPELNGYVSFMSGKKYGFVGLDRTTGDITTFHIKNISELIKKAPSLGFER